MEDPFFWLDACPSKLPVIDGEGVARSSMENPATVSRQQPDYDTHIIRLLEVLSRLHKATLKKFKPSKFELFIPMSATLITELVQIG